MEKKHWILISLTLLLCIICVLAIGIFMALWWHRPLGVSLSLPTRTPETGMIGSITTTLSVNTEAVIRTTKIPPTETPIPPTSTPTASPTPTPTDIPPVCAGPDRLLYIIAAGIDNSRQDYRYGRADVIRILRVDYVTPKVTVLTLPRDLWVELPGIKQEFDKLTHAKINTAYFYGAPALDRYEGQGGGPGLLAHTIGHNYGLYADQYVVINMLAFEQIVDALGGIDLNLAQTWDGRADRDAEEHEAWVFEEGEHHMSGAEALRFARIRLGYGEVNRTDNQTLVMCAIKEKMQRPQMIGAIPEMVTAFLGKVQTDLSPAQISQLICLLPKLDSETLQFVRFPDDMMVQGRTLDPMTNRETFFWDIPVESIRVFVADFMTDSIPMNLAGGGSRNCP